MTPQGVANALGWWALPPEFRPPYPWPDAPPGSRIGEALEARAVAYLEDYRVAAGDTPGRIGTASPFNVAIKSLRIGDFTADEVAELYKQRTGETGQEFTPEAVERAFAYTRGQPWLVNALA